MTTKELKNQLRRLTKKNLSEECLKERIKKLSTVEFYYNKWYAKLIGYNKEAEETVLILQIDPDCPLAWSALFPTDRIIIGNNLASHYLYLVYNNIKDITIKGKIITNLQEIAQYRNLTKGKLLSITNNINNILHILPTDISLTQIEKQDLIQIKQILNSRLAMWNDHTKDIIYHERMLSRNEKD